VVDDLHCHARVHAADVGQDLVAQLGVVSERAHDEWYRTSCDDELEAVGALRGGHQEMLGEALFEAE
jgi:hypothetical protein